MIVDDNFTMIVDNNLTMIVDSNFTMIVDHNFTMTATPARVTIATRSNAAFFLLF